MQLIAIGSNLPGAYGSPRAAVETALDRLEAAGVSVLDRSRWYETPAFPPGSGPPFVNGAARIAGPEDPAALLETLHRVEAQVGRSRPARWAPRVCDLDLLAVGAAVLPDAATVRAWMTTEPAVQRREAPQGLVLPHPRLHERGFVLVPLADVAPDWRHPLLGRTVAEMLADLGPEALSGIAPT